MMLVGLVEGGTLWIVCCSVSRFDWVDGQAGLTMMIIVLSGLLQSCRNRLGRLKKGERGCVWPLLQLYYL